mmetsp:Transcript_5777/g.8393  ORF Transcript_5777/g.8393 Transcript_5777/m.8393 type:complete len:109 (+) Transcript_5777:803-1129(+)
METLREGIKFTFSKKGIHAHSLNVSDLSLCAMIAAKEFGAANVTSLESSTNSVPMLSALAAQLGNSLSLQGNNFQVVNTYVEHLTRDILYNMNIEIVLAEPYFEILVG